MNKEFILLILLSFRLFASYTVQAQSRYDSLIAVSDSTTVRAQCYRFHNNVYIYSKPKSFGFITQIPKGFAYAARETVQRKSLPALAAITASTLLLVPADQYINDHIQQFARFIHLDSKRDYKTIVSFNLGTKEIPVYEAPQNLNSVFYSLGEGFTSVALSAGLFTFGKISSDYRALQSASQIIQSQLMVGLVTQSMKRISGRESPFRASRRGGAWHPFPGFNTYLNNTSKYDALPSGHLASMMATVTVLVSNYPEKKWLSITGYSLLGVVSFAMINNGVHWAGDYPLALGVGYICGKATVNLNRLLQYHHPVRVKNKA